MRELHEHKLSTHRFMTGNVVRLSKRFPPRNAAPGPYKVVAQLPERGGQFQYRVKSVCEPFYRTVTESELESDVEEQWSRAAASPRHGASQAAFWRRQFGVLTVQAEEVRALSTKVTADAAEPIKSQMARGVDGRAH